MSNKKDKIAAAIVGVELVGCLVLGILIFTRTKYQQGDASIMDALRKELTTHKE